MAADSKPTVTLRISNATLEEIRSNALDGETRTDTILRLISSGIEASKAEEKAESTSTAEVEASFLRDQVKDLKEELKQAKEEARSANTSIQEIAKSLAKKDLGEAKAKLMDSTTEAISKGYTDANPLDPEADFQPKLLEAEIIIEDEPKKQENPFKGMGLFEAMLKGAKMRNQ